VKGQFFGNACRLYPFLERGLCHAVLEPRKYQTFPAAVYQLQGFLANGVVDYLLGLLHTGGDVERPVRFRLYHFPRESLYIALSQPSQAGEKEGGLQNRYLTRGFRDPGKFLCGKPHLVGWDGLHPLQIRAGVLLYLPVPVGGVKRSEECRPITGDGIGVQLAFLMDGLRCAAQVFQKLVAQFHGHFPECAFASHEAVKVQECLFVTGVLLACVGLEVIDETAVQLVPVKELVTLVYDFLVPAAAQGFRLFSQPCVVVLFPLCLRVGVDVDAERFVAHHLVGGLVPVAGIIVEEVGQHLAALDFPCV